jgi:hypothetical protein
MINKKLERIKKLRKKGLTLKEVGLKIGLTSERVRQLLTPIKYQRCKVHKIKYESFCPYCRVLLVYPKALRQVFATGAYAIKAEFERLAQSDRNKEIILQRILLIKKLRDERHFTYAAISRFLDRDYSSIVNLYNKKI